MKILIVEDDEIILRTLEFKLKKNGYNITAVKDGKEALEKLKSDTFNLVITDLMFPFVIGVEILSHVKSNLPELPFAILSGANEEEVIMDAFNMGADDFITKPFRPGELPLRVKRLLIPYAKKNDVYSIL